MDGRRVFFSGTTASFPLSPQQCKITSRWKHFPAETTSQPTAVRSPGVWGHRFPTPLLSPHREKSPPGASTFPIKPTNRRGGKEKLERISPELQYRQRKPRLRTLPWSCIAWRWSHHNRWRRPASGHHNEGIDNLRLRLRLRAAPSLSKSVRSRVPCGLWTVTPLQIHFHHKLIVESKNGNGPTI